MNMKNKLKTTILGLFSALVLTINVNATTTLEEAVTFIQSIDRFSFDFTSQEAIELSEFLFSQDPEVIKEELAGMGVHLVSLFNASVLSESPRILRDYQNLINNITETQTQWFVDLGNIHVIMLVVGDLTLLPEITTNNYDSVINRYDLAGFTFAQIFPKMSNRGFSHPVYQREFKSYRNTLPRSQQIAITQAEVNGLIAAQNRTKEQDAWLTELTADLMALRLSQ
jgi:hypothetical protein